MNEIERFLKNVKSGKYGKYSTDILNATLYCLIITYIAKFHKRTPISKYFLSEPIEDLAKKLIKQNTISSYFIDISLIDCLRIVFDLGNFVFDIKIQTSSEEEFATQYKDVIENRLKSVRVC